MTAAPTPWGVDAIGCGGAHDIAHPGGVLRSASALCTAAARIGNSTPSPSSESPPTAAVKLTAVAEVAADAGCRRGTCDRVAASVRGTRNGELMMLH